VASLRARHWVRDVRDRSDGGIVEAALEADSAQRGKAVRDADEVEWVLREPRIRHAWDFSRKFAALQLSTFATQ
jgi:hypothetical protein